MLRYYVDFVLKLSYRSIVYVGRENIPQDGAIIYAPNHANTLMDALVVLSMDKKPKVFVARADIFKNRRLARVFTFLKIMPIMRLRDGFNEVKKNHETIKKAVDVLKDRVPFCIFPEGTHQAKHSMLPLSKGICRIAFQAQEMMPQMPLYIVPVGLGYGNFFRFRSTVRVQVGKPINVGNFMADHAELSQQGQMNAMRDELAKRMQSTIFYIPNDGDYDATCEVCNAAAPFEVERLLKENANKKEHSLNLQFVANNNTLERMAALKNAAPGKLQELLELGNEACVLRKSKGVSTESLAVKSPLLSRTKRILLMLVTLPYTVPASVSALPVVALCQYLFTKLKDPAFRNSVRLIMNLLVWPLLLLVYSITAFLLLPWQWAVAVTLLLVPAPVVAHELWRTIRVCLSDIKLLREKKLTKIYSRIRDIVMGV